MIFITQYIRTSTSNPHRYARTYLPNTADTPIL